MSLSDAIMELNAYDASTAKKHFLLLEDGAIPIYNVREAVKELKQLLSVHFGIEHQEKIDEIFGEKLI